MLENRLVYKVLFPHIRKLWAFLFDRSLRVRKSFLQLLIKLQNIKSFDLSAFFVLDDFLQMLRYDHTANPTNSINRLYIKFLTPLFWKEVRFSHCVGHRKTIRVSSRAFTIFSSTTPTPAPFSSRRAWNPRDSTAF